MVVVDVTGVDVLVVYVVGVSVVVKATAVVVLAVYVDGVSVVDVVAADVALAVISTDCVDVVGFAVVVKQSKNNNFKFQILKNLMSKLKHKNHVKYIVITGLAVVTTQHANNSMFDT